VMWIGAQPYIAMIQHGQRGFQACSGIPKVAKIQQRVGQIRLLSRLYTYLEMLVDVLVVASSM
jgi:hypothetical protein